MTATKPAASAAVMVRSLRGATGAARLICEQINFLHGKYYDITLHAEKVGAEVKSILPPTTDIQKKIKLPLKGYYSRLFFDYRCHRATVKHNYNLVIGHGDVLRQDILFLHNTIRLADEYVAPGENRNITFHGQLQDELLKRQHFDLCIANSGMMKADLCSRYGIDEQKVEIVYPGYDPQQFSLARRDAAAAAFRQQHGINSDAQVVGFITSGDFKKRGLDLFLATLDQLPDEVVANLYVLILGREENIKKYWDKSDKRFPSERLIFLEKTHQIEAVYKATDVLFYPARFEEFGMVAQEAIACGAAVVSSKRVGSAELFGDVSGNSVLDAPDVDQFAALLSELLPSKQRIRELAEAQRVCIGHNTYEHYNQRCLAILRQRGYL